MDDRKTISPDDIDDVIELTRKLQDQIFETLRDNELGIAMSALVSAFTESLIAQCDDIDEVIFYRDVTIHLFRKKIKEIRLQ